MQQESIEYWDQAAFVRSKKLSYYASTAMMISFVPGTLGPHLGPDLSCEAQFAKTSVFCRSALDTVLDGTELSVLMSGAWRLG